MKIRNRKLITWLLILSQIFLAIIYSQQFIESIRVFTSLQDVYIYFCNALISLAGGLCGIAWVYNPKFQRQILPDFTLDDVHYYAAHMSWIASNILGFGAVALTSQWWYAKLTPKLTYSLETYGLCVIGVLALASAYCLSILYEEVASQINETVTP